VIPQRTSLARGCATLAAAALLATGCSSSKSTPAAGTSTSPAGGTSTSAAPAGNAPSDTTAATQAVKDLYNKYFDNTVGAADKVNLVQNGAKMTELVNELSSGAKNAKSSVVVHSVAFTSATHATVSFDILLNNVPALPNATGQAVLDPATNTWQIADATLCTLAGLTPGMNPATVKTACPSS
jgi:hypothetical protein